MTFLNKPYVKQFLSLYAIMSVTLILCKIMNSIICMNATILHRFMMKNIQQTTEITVLLHRFMVVVIQYL